MHELSVTEALLALAVQHAAAAHAERITGVHLVIGQLSSVIDESVQFYWDLISAGTPAAGAQLHFRRVPAAFRCADCGQVYAPAAEILACPACAGVRVSLTGGEELYLEALDIEPGSTLAEEPVT
jgi:hydrogenase nickel incorporation protein HypA/HybF